MKLRTGICNRIVMYRENVAIQNDMQDHGSCLYPCNFENLQIKTMTMDMASPGDMGSPGDMASPQ